MEEERVGLTYLYNHGTAEQGEGSGMDGRGRGREEEACLTPHFIEQGERGGREVVPCVRRESEGGVWRASQQL